MDSLLQGRETHSRLRGERFSFAGGDRREHTKVEMIGSTDQLRRSKFIEVFD